MSLTSYRAAPPRVKPCLYVASTVNFWEARVPSRDGTYVAIASCLGKGAAHFYPTLCGKSHPQEKPQFSRTFRSLPPCGPPPGVGARAPSTATVLKPDPSA